MNSTLESLFMLCWDLNDVHLSPLVCSPHVKFSINSRTNGRNVEPILKSKDYCCSKKKKLFFIHSTLLCRLIVQMALARSEGEEEWKERNITFWDLLASFSMLAKYWALFLILENLYQVAKRDERTAKQFSVFADEIFRGQKKDPVKNRGRPRFHFNRNNSKTKRGVRKKIRYQFESVLNIFFILLSDVFFCRYTRIWSNEPSIFEFMTRWWEKKYNELGTKKKNV